MQLLNRMLSRFVRTGTLRIIDADGRQHLHKGEHTVVDFLEGETGAWHAGARLSDLCPVIACTTAGHSRGASERLQRPLRQALASDTPRGA